MAADKEASGDGLAPPGGPTTVPVELGREDVPVGRRSAGPNMKRRQVLVGWLLLSPALALYVAFIGIPLIGVILISFVQWDLVSAPRLGGYGELPGPGPRPAVGEVIADLVPVRHHDDVDPYRRRDGTGDRRYYRQIPRCTLWARTAFVAPFLMSAGVVALMWSYILNGESGPLNYYLRLIG